MNNTLIDDDKIIELYNLRDEMAISETDKKYGKLIFKIAFNILRSKEDSEEAKNDTYERAWTRIPPDMPRILSAYLSKVARNLSIDRFRYNKAKKRGGESETDILLSELSDCIPSQSTVSEETEMKMLKDIIDAWLENLPREDREMFMMRYWFGENIKDIASIYKLTSKNLTLKLFRIRQKLKTHLEKEGVYL